MTLTELGEACYRLSGSVDYDHAVALRAEVEALLDAQPRLELSLLGVEDGNSLLVALMIAWFRYARRRDCDLRFSDVPEPLFALIEFSELDAVLPIERDEAAAPAGDASDSSV